MLWSKSQSKWKKDYSVNYVGILIWSKFWEETKGLLLSWQRLPCVSNTLRKWRLLYWIYSAFECTNLHVKADLFLTKKVIMELSIKVCSMSIRLRKVQYLFKKFLRFVGLIDEQFYCFSFIPNPEPRWSK